MSGVEDLNAGAQEALAAARLGDLRKKVNAESWSNNMEDLLAGWGEKAAGLRFMHAKTGGAWKKFANNLSLSSIIITSVASTLSLAATQIPSAVTACPFAEIFISPLAPFIPIQCCSPAAVLLN